MRVRLTLLVVLMAYTLDFIVSEKSSTPTQHEETHAETAKYKEPISDKEMRGFAVQNFNGMLNVLRGRPKPQTIDVQGAKEAYERVNKVMGGKKTVKLTPKMAEDVREFATANPDKWLAMAYLLYRVLGVSLAVFMVFGIIFLGWRPAGTGGPRTDSASFS